MTVPVSYAAPGEKTSPVWCRAFAQGCGGRMVYATNRLLNGDVAMFGSPALWPILQHAQLERRTWWYGDHGMFGRGRYFRITRNRYQHPGLGTPDHARFRSFGRPIQPWRATGTHILICPNSPQYHALFGIDVQQWIAEVSHALHQVSDRPIRVRWKQDARAHPIEEDLKDCWAVVSWASVAAIDALIAGVPVFVLCAHASAYRMGLPDLSRIEQPWFPDDREDFMGCLAANQFSLPEMRSGFAWRMLTDTLRAPQATVSSSSKKERV